MGFDYRKQKEIEQHGNQWTSYSDLFMGLSFVFLLLYVAASLRSGTSGMQQQIQMRKVQLENEDLKNQLKVYNTLKQEYLEQEATQDEEKLYKDLMGKLDLLQDAAKSEKEKLEAQATENAKKETALNHYQQLIRNIMNANMIAKSRIKKRNIIIEDQEQTIGDLETTVANKKNEIAAREKQIASMNASLDKKMKELKWAYQHQKMTQKKFESQMAQAREEHDRSIASLKEQNSSAQRQLEAKLRSDFDAQRAKEKAAFDAELNAQKLSAADRAAKEAAFRAQAAQKERELAGKISNLSSQLSGTEAQLAKAKSEAEARRNIAREIKAGFAKAGIKAEIDGETGDVTLDFGDAYFETGKANIKPEMAKILQKAMPIYSKSLMENKKIADKISAVEIIGFASPTYKNRVIDPKSLDPADKKAAEYNMDLSYQRARSIYLYAFDTDVMRYNHQKEMRALVKVSGKSFFEAAKITREVASETPATFCKKFDCKKSQRVLIKFTVDQK